MSPRDGQLEPEQGIKFVPEKRAGDEYLLQIGSNPLESARLWGLLAPMSGINHLGEPKPNATVFGLSDGPRPEPIMVGAEVGAGRSLAFAGETWVWARSFEEGSRAAHRKFWRQVIFWLAHKEDKGENEVKLKLESRRIASGQKLDFSVTAHDAKGAPVTDLKYDTKVVPEGDAKEKYSEPVNGPFKKGDIARGEFIARNAPPGDYRMTVIATRDGKEIGRDSARFIVYEDDRELETPAADRALLRQIAEAPGGDSLTPELLPKYLQSLRGKLSTETSSLTEKRIWDNWPFFLLFTTLLTLEWFIRKRHGWV